MSDYLWNIAARALNRATVVRPRLTPLFGDPDPSPAFSYRGLSQNESPITEPLLAPVQHPTRAIGPRPTHRVPSQWQSVAPTAPPFDPESPDEIAPQPTHMERAPVEPVRSFETERRTRARLPEFEITLKGPAPVAQAKSETAAPLVVPVAVPISQEPAPLPLLVSRPRSPASSVRAETGPSPNQILLRSPTVESAASDLAAPLHKMRPFPHEPLQSQRSVSPVEQEHKVAKQAAGRLPAIPVVVARALAVPPVSVSTTPAPAPSIQVTIGRIEVRATPAAQSTRPATPKGSSISLEEYLKRRAQGSGS